MAGVVTSLDFARRLSFIAFVATALALMATSARAIAKCSRAAVSARSTVVKLPSASKTP